MNDQTMAAEIIEELTVLKDMSEVTNEHVWHGLKELKHNGPKMLCESLKDTKNWMQ